jgi:hypothetical protein
MAADALLPLSNPKPKFINLESLADEGLHQTRTAV